MFTWLYICWLVSLIDVLLFILYVICYLCYVFIFPFICECIRNISIRRVLTRGSDSGHQKRFCKRMSKSDSLTGCLCFFSKKKTLETINILSWNFVHTICVQCCTSIQGIISYKYTKWRLIENLILYISKNIYFIQNVNGRCFKNA